MDKAEGAGKGYDRIDDFRVHIAGCRGPLGVVTYIANVASDPDLKPYDWYLKLIVTGNRKSRLEALELLGEDPE